MYNVHIVREITQGLISRDKITRYLLYTCIIMFVPIYTLYQIFDLELI